MRQCALSLFATVCYWVGLARRYRRFCALSLCYRLRSFLTDRGTKVGKAAAPPVTGTLINKVKHPRLLRLRNTGAGAGPQKSGSRIRHKLLMEDVKRSQPTSINRPHSAGRKSLLKHLVRFRHARNERGWFNMLLDSWAMKTPTVGAYAAIW